MARRLPQTLADYLVIAISPALIMALVGSLMFFLLRVFYQGDFQERLHWVMACFVFAAVLIARISISDGFERAAPFGAALAILVGIAANRFMEYHGAWIDDFSWIVNFAILGLVWWCIHKLTWDCTVIDEDRDASGEGLMQVVGLEQPATADNGHSPAAGEAELEGTTGGDVRASFWQRYVRHQRRPHTPGVWVVYFSLAALPIFGIGQWFIPVSDVGGRLYVFWLLAVYVASGLALLVTTSFLGLRRYLRQRRIEMPTSMASLWLITGGAVIAVLLVAAALLPRPSAEFAISRLPFSLGSPEQRSSRLAPAKQEGVRDEQPKSSGESEKRDTEAADESRGGSGKSGQGQSEDGTSDDQKGRSGGEQASGQSESAGKSEDKSGQPSAQGNEGKPLSSEQGQRAEKADATGKAADDSPGQSEQKQGKQQDKSGKPSAGGNPLENMRKYRQLERELASQYEDQPRETPDSEKQAAPDESESAEGSSPAEPPPTEMPSLEPPLGPLATLVQYVFYGLVIAGTVLAVWYYRREIIGGVRNFLRELADWWRTLWGGKPVAATVADEKLEVRLPPARFASFADPFASGAAARMSPEQLVRYSFDAFEAWSAEHGCPRELDQTPHELVRDVARLNAFISSDARNLAELYVRAAFAKGQLPPGASEQLASLWRQMTRPERVSV